MTQMMDMTALNRDRVNAFADRLTETMNHAGLALMISLGHRTGLLDAMASLPAATAEQIAEKAGLQPRYVREWLGAMVAGRVVIHDPVAGTYDLPAEHAALLTRGAPLGNMAAAFQFLPMLGGVEEQVAECFRKGGGVPYEKFHRFHEVMAEESANTVVAALDSQIVPLVPGLKQRLTRGIRVLDVGCGSGRAMIHLARQYPASVFRGYDFCPDAIAAARREAAAAGLTNVTFEVRDCTTLNETGQYDLITAFDAIHDQIDPAAVLAGIHAALRPDGVFFMQDIRASSHVEKNVHHPLGAFLYTISTMHCMTVSLAHGGAGLGTCWGEETAVRMLGEAGFTDVEVHRPSHDIMNNFYVSRK